MSKINPYSFGYGQINPYRPTAPAGEVQGRPEVQQTGPVRPAEARQMQANGLSADEQQMIDRYFPSSPALTLRLYGADRSAQQVNPNALGSRLDLKG